MALLGRHPHGQASRMSSGPEVQGGVCLAGLLMLHDGTDEDDILHSMRLICSAQSLSITRPRALPPRPLMSSREDYQRVTDGAAWRVNVD